MNHFIKIQNWSKKNKKNNVKKFIENFNNKNGNKKTERK